jgi:hypothetical protein
MPKPSEQAAFGIYPQAGKRGQRKPTAKEQLAQIFSDDRAMELPKLEDYDLSVPTMENRALSQRISARQADLKRQSDEAMSPLEKIAGGIQTGRLIGSGMYQAAKSLPTAITKGGKAAEEYIAENIYKPNQPKAYEYAEDVGNFLQSLESDYKIPPIIPQAMMLQNVIGPATRQAGRAAQQGARQGALNLAAPRTLNSQAGVFVGPKAKTWNKAKADMAVGMEKSGYTPEEVWQATGTFRGADGILRQEIDDRAAKLVLPDEQQDRVAALKGRVGELKESIKPTPQKDLFPKALTEAKKGVRSDIDALKEEISGRSKNARTQGIDAQYAFDHPELYEAYPELRNLNITMGGNEGASQGAMGSLSVLPKSGGYPGHMEMDMYNRGLMSKNPTSTALHEMQHAVQTLEGMGPGGSPTFAFQNPEAFEILKQLREEAYKPASFEDFQRVNKYPEDEAKAAYVQYVNERKANPITSDKVERALQETAAMTYYKRLAGEAEARAVQDRQMMTPQQRLQYPPPTSYDVPQEDLIVKPPREYADGGPVHFSDNPDVMQLELAGGGLVKKLASTVGKAAESAGMKAPVTAGKDLTTLQDVHTNLGDRVRAGAMEAQKMMGGFDYQYDKGQRVFTKDSAGKNKPPYTILNRTRVGNQVMREDHPEFGPGMGKPIIDPETGKAMRSPYEPGYRVRMERGPDDWSEFEIPQKAIVGDVEMAGGGLVGKLSKTAKAAAKPVKGTQDVLPAAEREENLQKFLGNSRIRERLYHATPKDFKQFKPGGDDPTMSGPAIWLTPDATKQPAAHNISSRTQEFREGTNVMPVHVQARSPLMLDDKLSIEWARDVFADGSSEFPDLIAPKTIEELKKEGYDSIIHADPYGNRGGEQEIIMFEPNKIKSAIGNRGTYDIEDPDITKADGGAVQMSGGGALAKMGAKGAAKGAKEAAVPLSVPRVRPTTKDIFEAAERVGKQQAGEFVRSPLLKDTTNLAGRSKREFDRLKKLDYKVTPIKDLPEMKPYEAKIGEVNIALPGDQTISDMLLESVDGIPIGTTSEGGALFGRGRLSDPEETRAFWASNIGPAELFQKKVTELAQLYDTDMVTAYHLAMGQMSNNFAQHMADASIRAIDYSKLNKDKMNAFDKVVSKGYVDPTTKERVTFENWPGIASPEEALQAMKEDPKLRKWFNNRMKTEKVTKPLDLPNAKSIEYAMTEPELRDMEINLTGLSAGRMKPGAELIPDSAHQTYSHDIPGTALGRAPELSPFSISFPDVTAFVREKYRPQDFTGTIQKVFPHQVVDEAYLDDMYKYYTQLRKVRGFNEGGSVRKAAGGEITADDLILEERKL